MTDLVAPLIYERGMGKRDLFDHGRRLAREFNRAHELWSFDLRISTLIGSRGCYVQQKRRVVINIDNTLMPPRVPGYSWSYPGYKADCTAAGVICHEMGHHVWHYLRVRHGAAFDGWRRGWRIACGQEAPVSSYGVGDHEEEFAESVKLFILNPSLLEEGRPSRHHMLRELALEPIHGAHWTEVLRNAHAMWLGATRKWIER